MSSHMTTHVPPSQSTSSTYVPPTQSTPSTNVPPTPNVVQDCTNVSPTQSTPSTNVQDSTNVSPSENGSNDCKPTFNLDGEGFLPSHPAANAITDIFRSYYNEPWPTWRKIPENRRTMMFGEFMKYSVCPPDAIWARNNFESRGQKLMKDSLSKAHRDQKKPRWLGDHVWNGLCDHWETPKFKEKSVKAKANRASDREGFGGTLHIGGSITTSQHRDNLMKKNGFNPSPLDLFRSTHQRKDGTFVDKKSEHVDGAYVREMEDRTQRASEQNLPPPSELDVWRDVAGMKKGRIYGLGLESTVINKQYHGSCSSSSEWVRRSEFDQLRNTIMEETQRMVKQMMEERMQQPPMPTPRGVRN
ncbi:uncharacterized protein LOC130728738 isoform X2 [Lotus japonicus]|uniref:uncharacterized protein LOC130728738 isoform X2 n=1 Tax=Lotus japonicus TaxID=34305 RepID=UPI00258B0C07|nr:uncharacterized protein LOC130728738 isoform X2 [Lotus japonicus]